MTKPSIAVHCILHFCHVQLYNENNKVMNDTRLIIIRVVTVTASLVITENIPDGDGSLWWRLLLSFGGSYWGAKAKCDQQMTDATTGWSSQSFPAGEVQTSQIINVYTMHVAPLNRLTLQQINAEGNFRIGLFCKHKGK